MAHFVKKILISSVFIFLFALESNARVNQLKYSSSEQLAFWNISDSQDDYLPSDELEHFSQSNFDHREDFNDNIISNFNLGKYPDLQLKIKKYKISQGLGDLLLVLQAIANVANVAYNENRVGHHTGTIKHTLCKELLNAIKLKHSEFLNLNAEFTMSSKIKKEYTRFDVILLSNKDAYIFDYKFGEDGNNSTSSTIEQRKRIVKENGYNFKGHYDVKPTN